MATFFMFGKYTCEAIREVSIERTQEAVNEIEKLGCFAVNVYVFIAPAPRHEARGQYALNMIL